VIGDITRRAAQSLADFLRLEAAGGILLIAAALLALIAANTPLAAGYNALFDLPVQVRIGALDIDKPLLLWINDGFMAVFFLLVGLELKRELVEGQFANRAQIALPALCAIGGMIVPMAIYAGLNHGDAAAMSGFAIPAATDIAFALGILSLLGSRVPLALKVLLTAIAVADDLGAIILIALFYTHELSLLAAGVALLALAGLVLLNRRGVTRLAPYLLIGGVLWVAMLKSGVHATLAGVILGMTIPLGDRRNPEVRPLETLEHRLHPWVAFAILPLFAFANAGVPLVGLSFASLLQPVPLGIAAGLVLGKQIGIFGAAALAIKLGWMRMPEGVQWRTLYGMSILCGIGFTMSLFIGSLAFESGQPDLMVSNRIGILAGSLIAAVAGYAVLRRGLPRSGA
jgi:NhaA family Na+:H+ antiporter